MGARGVVIGLRLGHYTVRPARVACSRSVLARRRETFGSTNRPVADALRELAMVKMASGDEREVLDLLREGIVVLRLSTGDNPREFAGLHLDIGEQLQLAEKLIRGQLAAWSSDPDVGCARGGGRPALAGTQSSPGRVRSGACPDSGRLARFRRSLHGLRRSFSRVTCWNRSIE